MKYGLLALALSYLLCACGDLEKSNTAKTTPEHSVHDSSNHTAAAPSDTAAAGGSTMMGIMHSMMSNMGAIASTNDPDTDFAALMRSHHQSALEMAQLEIAQGTDEGVKAMANKILQDQQKEISEFDNYLANNKADGGGNRFHQEAMSAMGHDNMDMSGGGSVDEEFIKNMIPHHQGAVDMARIYLKYGKDDVMKKMANSIIASQQREIKEFQEWLSKRKTAPADNKG